MQTFALTSLEVKKKNLHGHVVGKNIHSCAQKNKLEDDNDNKQKHGQMIKKQTLKRKEILLLKNNNIKPKQRKEFC